MVSKVKTEEDKTPPLEMRQLPTTLVAIIDLFIIFSIVFDLNICTVSILWATWKYRATKAAFTSKNSYSCG